MNDPETSDATLDYSRMARSVVDALGAGRCCGCLQYFPLTQLARVPAHDGFGNRYCLDRKACVDRMSAWHIALLRADI